MVPKRKGSQFLLSKVKKKGGPMSISAIFGIILSVIGDKVVGVASLLAKRSRLTSKWA